MEPGCESIRVNIDRQALIRDGYFRVDFVRHEVKPTVYSKKLQRMLPAKTVDYLGLASSPIYYDIEPFGDHWKPTPK